MQLIGKLKGVVIGFQKTKKGNFNMQVASTNADGTGSMTNVWYEKMPNYKVGQAVELEVSFSSEMAFPHVVG